MNTSRPIVQAHPETGEVVVERPNPEFASIRVDQETTSFEGGFLNKTKRVAFIGGRTEDLKALNFKAGKKMPGKIVVHEAISPFWDGQEPKINPETAEVLTHNGQEIYRNAFYTENVDATDKLLDHDKQTVSNTVSQESDTPAFVAE